MIIGIEKLVKRENHLKGKISNRIRDNIQ